MKFKKFTILDALKESFTQWKDIHVWKSEIHTNGRPIGSMIYKWMFLCWGCHIWATNSLPMMLQFISYQSSGSFRCQMLFIQSCSSVIFPNWDPSSLRLDPIHWGNSSFSGSVTLQQNLVVLTCHVCFSMVVPMCIPAWSSFFVWFTTMVLSLVKNSEYRRWYSPSFGWFCE